MALYDIDMPKEPAWKRWCRLAFAALVMKVAAALHRIAMGWNMRAAARQSRLMYDYDFPQFQSNSEASISGWLAKVTLLAFMWAERQASRAAGVTRVGAGAAEKNVQGKSNRKAPRIELCSLPALPIGCNLQDPKQMYRRLYGITDQTVAAFRKLREEVKAHSSGSLQKFIAEVRPCTDISSVEVTIWVMVHGMLYCEDRVLILPNGDLIR